MDNVVAEAKTNDSSGSDETDTKSGYFSDDWIFENKQIIRREGDRANGCVCFPGSCLLQVSFLRTPISGKNIFRPSQTFWNM